MKKKDLKELIKRIVSNKTIKEEELQEINKFKDLYEIISKYENQNKTYEEIMSSNNSRLEFLTHAVDIALNNKNMDRNTTGLILSMYDKIYKYLFENSELEEIQIPNNMKEKLKDNMILPNFSELLFAITLVQENIRIFEKYFNDKDFSQTINQGLHTNIKEVLKIERHNIGHLLGITNDDAIYNFNRKKIIDKKIKEFCKELGIEEKDKDSSELFKTKFKDFFGLDFNEENHIKLVSWKKRKEMKDIKPEENITEEEIQILNKSFDIIPKEQILDFYSNETNIDDLIRENNKVNNFVYKYIRSDIILKQYETKKGRNDLKKIFNTEELNNILNTDNNPIPNNIRNLINTYIKKTKLDLSIDNSFQKDFTKEFYYPYPLIQYNELITKNISFYNFSLFKNINKIIVDFNKTGTETHSDVFLVSYAKKKYKKFKTKFQKKLESKKNKYIAVVDGEEENDKSLDKEYINQLRSLLRFPPDTRYYLRFGFSQKEEKSPKDNQDEKRTNQNRKDYEKEERKKILKRMKKKVAISLIGFATDESERKRIDNLNNNSFESFEHHHFCETNMTANFQEYEEDYLKNGIEYEVEMIAAEPSSSDREILNRKRNTEGGGPPPREIPMILKIKKPLEILSDNIDLLNDYITKKNIDYNEKIEYELNLIKEIKRTNELYLKIEKNKINILNYKLNNIDKLNINELNNLKNELYLNNNKYIKLKDYNDKINNYLDNYEKIIKDNTQIIYKKLDNKTEIYNKEKKGKSKKR